MECKILSQRLHTHPHTHPEHTCVIMHTHSPNPHLAVHEEGAIPIYIHHSPLGSPILAIKGSCKPKARTSNSKTQPGRRLHIKNIARGPSKAAANQKDRHWGGKAEMDRTGLQQGQCRVCRLAQQ
eukprot:1158344-Pelagomonas_calceolata.AAC.4